MKTTRFTESQIVHALKDYEGGKKAEVVCRDLVITKTTFYNWKKRYLGMDGEHLRRLKELEEENRKLKSTVSGWFLIQTQKDGSILLAGAHS